MPMDIDTLIAPCRKDGQGRDDEQLVLPGGDFLLEASGIKYNDMEDGIEEPNQSIHFRMIEIATGTTSYEARVPNQFFAGVSVSPDESMIAIGLHVFDFTNRTIGKRPLFNLDEDALAQWDSYWTSPKAVIFKQASGKRVLVKHDDNGWHSTVIVLSSKHLERHNEALLFPRENNEPLVFSLNGRPIADRIEAIMLLRRPLDQTSRFWPSAPHFLWLLRKYSRNSHIFYKIIEYLSPSPQFWVVTNRGAGGSKRLYLGPETECVGLTLDEPFSLDDLELECTWREHGNLVVRVPSRKDGVALWMFALQNN